MQRRKLLKIALALVCAVCLVVLGLRALDLRTGRESYAKAQELIELPQIEEKRISAASDAAAGEQASPLAEALAGIDISVLKQYNPDVIGWIYIPDTIVSYPLLIGVDNQQYLRHTWLGEYSTMGSIFMECNSEPDLSDFNTIVYGHRMRDMSMFAILQYYDQKEYWEAHPSVFLVNDEGVWRYDIYAAYEAGVRAPAYELWVTDPERQAAIIQYGVEHSEIDTGIHPAPGDQILTLSTCPSRGTATRWIVQAVLGDTFRTEGMDVAQYVQIG